MVSLRRRLTSGVVVGDLTDASLDIRSTSTVAAGRLWAVNLRFHDAARPEHGLLDHTAAAPSMTAEEIAAIRCP
jgi:hypothetical protein